MKQHGAERKKVWQFSGPLGGNGETMASECNKGAPLTSSHNIGGISTCHVCARHNNP